MERISPYSDCGNMKPIKLHLDSGYGKGNADGSGSGAGWDHGAGYASGDCIAEESCGEYGTGKGNGNADGYGFANGTGCGTRDQLCFTGCFTDEENE